MVSKRLEAQRQTILHFWLNGTRSPTEIHRKTKIPLRTVEKNIKKLKEGRTVAHKRGNGRPTKVTQNVAAAIGQHVRRNTAISTRQIAVKLQETQDISISYSAVWRHMKKKNMKALCLVERQCWQSGISRHEKLGHARICAKGGARPSSPTRQHSTFLETRSVGGTSLA